MRYGSPWAPRVPRARKAAPQGCERRGPELSLEMPEEVPQLLRERAPEAVGRGDRRIDVVVRPQAAAEVHLVE